MIPGDILIVTNSQTGQEHEAVVRWIMPGGWVRCEWIAGPEDGNTVYVEMHNEVEDE
jgi:hypothetical protein